MTEATQHPVTVAAFDFDETLTRHDSVVPFLRRVAGTRRLLTGLLLRAHRVVPALVRRDRDTLRLVATEVVFRRADATTVEQHAVRFAETIIADGLRQDTVGRLQWHLEQGHQVVIVSASYEHYVRVVADHLGIHGVAATRLELGSGGRYTGRLDGRNCRAAEKVVRLDAWLAERGLHRRHVTLWAYGDSSGDRDLLAVADHPVWVHAPIASVAAS